MGNCNDCEHLFASRNNGMKKVFCVMPDGVTFRQIAEHDFGCDIVLNDRISVLIVEPDTGEEVGASQVMIELSGMPLPSPYCCHKVKQNEG